MCMYVCVCVLGEGWGSLSSVLSRSCEHNFKGAVSATALFLFTSGNVS